MTKFNVHFRTDLRWAEKVIAAKEPSEALRRAHRLIALKYDEIVFNEYELYDTVNEIEVRDQDGNTVAVWRDGDLKLRLAARELLDAAEAVVRLWQVYGMSDAIRNLVEAVETAKEGPG